MSVCLYVLRERRQFFDCEAVVEDETDFRLESTPRHVPGCGTYTQTVVTYKFKFFQTLTLLEILDTTNVIDFITDSNTCMQPNCGINSTFLLTCLYFQGSLCKQERLLQL